MAHRSSNNAYSRRPSDDDRRGSDAYERRRGSYGRSMSDSYYRDRERDRDRDWDRDRDRDRSRDQDRDRDRDRDRSRDRDRDTGRRGDIPSSPRVRDSSQERVPFANAPRGPKALSLTSASSDLGVGRVRQDHHGSAGSSPVSPAVAMNIDSSNSAEAAISKIFRAWQEDVSEYTRLMIPRENLDKAVKVREAEFNNASQRPEFPSVPEFHKKVLNRDRTQLKELDEKIKKHQHRAIKTASQMGQLLLTALPLVEMKKAAKDADTVCQKGDLDAFRQEFQEMKAEFVKFRDSSTQENAALQEQVKDLGSRLTQSETEKDAIQKTMEAMEVEHGKLQNAFIIEVADLQKQLSEVKSRQDKAHDNADEISKLAACNAELVAKNTELQMQIGEIRTERSQLQTQLSDLEAHFTRLDGAIETMQQESARIGTKLGEFQSQVQAGLELSSSNYQSLHEKSAQQDIKLQQQGNTLAVVEQRLIHLDLEALDEISRNWTFDWDKMRKAVRKLQDDWHDVQKAVQATQEDLARHQRHPSHNPEPKTSPAPLTAEQRGQSSTSPASIAEISRQVQDGIAPGLNQVVTERIKKFTDGTIGMFNEIGDTLDKTRKELVDLGARLQSIETSQPDMRLTALESDLAQVKVLEGKFEQVKDVIDGGVEQAKNDLEGRIEQAKNDLDGKIGQVKNDLETLKTDLTGKADSMELQVSVLSTQFENLSTKELAEQIIGHMGQLTPSPHQLLTDMKELDATVQEIQKQLRDISAGSFYKDAFTKEYNGLEDTQKYVQTHKRRRIDSSANGVHQQPVS